MPIIAINKVKVLMILAESVESISGQLLLNKGEVITESDIRSFKTWGITEVSIESMEGEEPNPPIKKIQTINSETIKKAKLKTAELFRHSNSNHPAMRMMAHLAILNNLKELSEVKNIDEA